MSGAYKFKGGDKISAMDTACVRPYGDTYNDGRVQLSFTLPVPGGARAVEAARQLLLNIGLKEPAIVFDKDIGEGFTYFVAYAKTDAYINFDKIEVAEVATKTLTREQIDLLIAERFKRKLVVIGACTGNDAHTVGIDAIINMKGVDHHFGLERYEGFDAYNLGSQVKNEELLQKALELKTDAVLISQIVTQKDTHIHNLTSFVELAEAEGVRNDMLIIVGGPRITHKLALELGFDAGFGRKTFPEHVASFIVDKLWERMNS